MYKSYKQNPGKLNAYRKEPFPSTIEQPSAIRLRYSVTVLMRRLYAVTHTEAPLGGSEVKPRLLKTAEADWVLNGSVRYRPKAICASIL
jgi:hypothetical protein